MARRLSALFAFTMLLALPALAAAADNAPEFLSRRVADSETHPPDTWSATENVAWRADIPGLGWSSPVVWGNRVFVTTVTVDGETPEPKKGLYIQNVDATKAGVPTTVHHWLVYCLDLNSGEVLWKKEAHAGPPEQTRHIKNTYASETPVTDGERLYAYFGNRGVYCFDLEGNALWSVDVAASNTRLGWGTAASPTLHGDHLYIVNDNEDESYLLALDRRTGEEAWRVERDENSNWATPYVWENELRTELVTPGSGAIRSYDLQGNELWQLGGMSSIAIPKPFEVGGRLYVTSGYVNDKKKPVYCIRPGASGDISLEDEATSNDYIVWTQKQAGPYHPTPIAYDGQIYVLLDRGFLASYDLETGEEIYGRQRIPNGRAFTSSPVAYDGKLFCLNEDGVCFVCQAGPEFDILHTNELEEDTMCMASPTVLADRLLIRTDTQIYCIQ